MRYKWVTSRVCDKDACIIMIHACMLYMHVHAHTQSCMHACTHYITHFSCWFSSAVSCSLQEIHCFTTDLTNTQSHPLQHYSLLTVVHHVVCSLWTGSSSWTRWDPSPPTCHHSLGLSHWLQLISGKYNMMNLFTPQCSLSTKWPA